MGDSINLPQNVFTTGQAVIYHHANGGSAGGLVDGSSYRDRGPEQHTGSFGLHWLGLATAANAKAAPIPIQLGSVMGTGNYLSEVDVEAQRAGWSQSQLQNSMDLSIVEPVLFPSTAQTIPDPNIEGKNVAIVAGQSIGTVSGQVTIALPLTAALPQNEALDLAAAEPADVTFYNAGMVAVSPTSPNFNPVELVVNLQDGISLENTGLVDANAGQNIDLDSGQDVVNKGPLLPITIDHIVAQGGAVGHPTGVVRVLGLDGLINGAASGINITSGNLFLEGGNTGGIGTGIAPLTIDLAPGSLLEEANAQLDVDIDEKNGSLDLVTAFSATGNVNLTADGSILNGNTFNNVNVEGVNIDLLAGQNGVTTDTIGSGTASLDVVLTGGSVVAQADQDIYLDATGGSNLTVKNVHSLLGDLFLSAVSTPTGGSILEDPSVLAGTAVAKGNNITLSADSLLGFIGSPTQAFEIDAIALARTLTASKRPERLHHPAPRRPVPQHGDRLQRGHGLHRGSGRKYLQRQSGRPERPVRKDVPVRQPQYRHVRQPDQHPGGQRPGPVDHRQHLACEQRRADRRRRRAHQQHGHAVRRDDQRRGHEPDHDHPERPGEQHDQLYVHP